MAKCMSRMHQYPMTGLRSERLETCRQRARWLVIAPTVVYGAQFPVPTPWM